MQWRQRPQLSQSLLREQATDVGEGLQLDGVAAWVSEEQGGLFAGLALEADVRRDDEVDAGRSQALGGQLPLIHRQDDSKVADGDAVAIHRAGSTGAALGRGQMGDDLVTVEIEVHPVR